MGQYMQSPMFWLTLGTAAVQAVCMSDFGFLSGFQNAIIKKVPFMGYFGLHCAITFYLIGYGCWRVSFDQQSLLDALWKSIICTYVFSSVFECLRRIHRLVK